MHRRPGVVFGDRAQARVEPGMERAQRERTGIASREGASSPAPDRAVADMAHILQGL